jgi:hypothetical protein
MKYLFVLLLGTFSVAQGQDIDAMLAEPQTIELAISTPQPRMKEKFQITLDINHLRANIFRSLAGKVQLADEIGYSDKNKMILNLNALNKGRNELGPLKFVVNGTVYTTNKISYEVVDALPDVDKGIWFRKVNMGDSMVCIIIDQRIPATEKKTITSDNSFTFTTEPETSEIVKFKSSYSIPGLSGGNSTSSTDYGTLYDADGKPKQYLYAWSVYYFNIDDKSKKITITKDKFDNLPADYKFQDIIVR